MPYLKPRKKRFEEMTRLLKGYGFNGENLADVILCSPPTARKRIENPELLTLQDLENINRRGHIPLEKIREAISP